MRVMEVLRRIIHNSDLSAKSLSDTAALLEQMLSEIRDGIAGQSDLINRRVAEVVVGIANQSDLVNQKLSEAIEGIAHQADVTNSKLNALAETVDQLVFRLVSKIDSLIELQKAEIVMQRDQAEAIDELARALTCGLKCPKEGASPASRPE